MIDITDINTEIVNENSLLIRFAYDIDADLPRIISIFSGVIVSELANAITDLVPAYTTLLVVIDKHRMSILHFQICIDRITHSDKLKNALIGLGRQPKGIIVSIPVLYDFSVAPDLQRMLQARNMLLEEFVEIHTSKMYSVFTLGFLPGFAFMGVLDPRLAEPRLPTPRSLVLKGSVGIAGQQTGIYPMDSPGGWNIIGRTPQTMLWQDGDGQLSSAVAAGDNIKFFAITKNEFENMTERRVDESQI